jgi:hypothetical protein
MRSLTRSLTLRQRLLAGIGLTVILLIIASTLFVVHQWNVASQPTASQMRQCRQEEHGSAPIFLPGDSSPVTITISAGEPVVVAVVNGDALCRQGLEWRVDGTLANNQKTLQQLQKAPQGTTWPPSLLALLKQTPNQVRHAALSKMIDEQLLLQAGNRLGLTASLAAARAFAQQQLAILQKQPASSQARVTTDEYLRAHHFTEQSYFSDPQVIQAYRDSLTMEAAEQHVVAGKPAGESQQASISAYEQHLWQTGNVHVFLPARLGWQGAAGRVVLDVGYKTSYVYDQSSISDTGKDTGYSCTDDVLLLPGEV